MTKEYELNEKDIDSVLNYLKLTDPKHATPEMAIAILDYMYATQERMSFDDPEQLEAVIQGWKKKNKSN